MRPRGRFPFPMVFTPFEAFPSTPAVSSHCSFLRSPWTFTSSPFPPLATNPRSPPPKRAWPRISTTCVSTSRSYSNVESVAPNQRCHRFRARCFHGLFSLFQSRSPELLPSNRSPISDALADFIPEPYDAHFTSTRRSMLHPLRRECRPHRSGATPQVNLSRFVNHLGCLLAPTQSVRRTRLAAHERG